MSKFEGDKEAMSELAPSMDMTSFAIGLVFDVSARKGWQASGVILSGKGTIQYDVFGTWKYEPHRPACGPDGEPSLPTQGRLEYAYHDAGSCTGQLVGKWGPNGKVFSFTRSGIRALSPTDSGMLYLAINDDLAGALGAGVNDNEGSLRVSLGYTP